MQIPTPDLIPLRFFLDPQKLFPILKIDIEAARTEAAMMYQILEQGDIDRWRKYVLSHPPSADAIAFLLVKHQRQSKSQTSRLAANRRHVENRAMKEQVFQWLDEHFKNFRSMDKAAEEIAGKVVPISFRTARAWVGQWKKLRSASRP